MGCQVGCKVQFFSSLQSTDFTHVSRSMLQAARGWLEGVEDPAWCDGSDLPAFPELFLCEIMHQIALSMADDRRKEMVDFFRKRFKKQVLIAFKALGPLMRGFALHPGHRDARAVSRVVEAFAKYSCVPPHIPAPALIRVAAKVACEDIIPKYMPGISSPKECLSSREELLGCMEYLVQECNTILGGCDRQPTVLDCCAGVVRGCVGGDMYYGDTQMADAAHEAKALHPHPTHADVAVHGPRMSLYMRRTSRTPLSPLV